MSFLFPKPKVVTKSRNRYSGSDFESVDDFNFDDIHYYLIENQEPDYNELLVRLSLYAFDQLSPADQQEQIAKISHAVSIEDAHFLEESSDAIRLRLKFEELFKKLNYEDQRKLFLSEVIQKFKREGQQFGFLSENGDENGSTRTSCFTGFFFGFSVIWFQGQSKSGQDMLIKQLDKGVGGVLIKKHMQDESEKDFRLRRFTELCKKVVDFRVQKEFLENAEWKLQQWGSCCGSRLIGEPQKPDTAAVLLSRLYIFGIRFLSAKYQQQKIDEISDQVESAGCNCKTGCFLFLLGGNNQQGDRREPYQTSIIDDHERIRRLTELFNQVPVATRFDLFKEMRKTLLMGKSYCEAVRVFRGLGSEYQMEIIEYMLNEIRTESCEFEVDPAAEVIVENESEEEVRFRRFIKMCIGHLSIWESIVWPEAYRLQLHSACDPYDEFLFGVSLSWFTAKCANAQRNPIEVILFGEVEIGDTIEKQSEESEEDYRLRRFEESFKQLEFSYQECVIDYIQETLFRDLGYSEPSWHFWSAISPSEGKGLFDPEWINYRPTNPRNLVGVTAQGQTVGGATTQAAVVEGMNQPLPAGLVLK